MSTNLKYAVVVPMYNASKYIRETVLSIISQDLKPEVIVVVDDMSKDESLEVVHQLQNEFPNLLHLIQLSQNSGTAAAPRNQGLSYVKNLEVDFVAFCDADDLWCSNKMSQQINAMVRRGYPVCFCDVDRFKGEADISCRFFGDYSREKICGLRDFLYTNMVKSCSGIVLNRDVFDICSFPDGREFRGIEDYFAWLRILASGKEFIFMPVKLVKYRQHDHSVSSSKFYMSRLRLNTYDYKKKFFIKSGIHTYNRYVSELLYLATQGVSRLFK